MRQAGRQQLLARAAGAVHASPLGTGIYVTSVMAEHAPVLQATAGSNGNAVASREEFRAQVVRPSIQV